MRYGMVIDLKRCINCRACSIACKMENVTPPGIFWSDVLTFESGKYPNVKKTFIPTLCMHCGDPICVKVCPTGASYKREDGVVLVDYDKCFGCGYCVVACPYQVRSLNEKSSQYFLSELTPYERRGYPLHKVGVAEKCNFCIEKVEKGEEPACVETCQAKARYFGDLDDPQSEVSKLIRNRHGFQFHREFGTDPSVYYLSA